MKADLTKCSFHIKPSLIVSNREGCNKSFPKTTCICSKHTDDRHTTFGSGGTYFILVVKTTKSGSKIQTSNDSGPFKTKLFSGVLMEHQYG